MRQRVAARRLWPRLGQGVSNPPVPERVDLELLHGRLQGNAAGPGVGCMYRLSDEGGDRLGRRSKTRGRQAGSCGRRRQRRPGGAALLRVQPVHAADEEPEYQRGHRHGGAPEPMPANEDPRMRSCNSA